MRFTLTSCALLATMAAGCIRPAPDLRAHNSSALVARSASPEPAELEQTSLTLMPAIIVPSSGQTTAESHYHADNAATATHQSLWDYDKATFGRHFVEDLEGLGTRTNALVLLAAAGASFVVHEAWDDDVADFTAEHPNRWGEMQNVIGGIGNPVHHAAVLSGVYTYSLFVEDFELHAWSKSALSAVAITAASTHLLKIAANTTRPNGHPGGWPSGHTSSSFAMAAVLDEYYGHRIGVPAYALAGLVAWERIDDREHDLSDVVFGAALGWVIGRSVAGTHQCRVGGMQVEPFVDLDTGTTGVGLEHRF